MMYKGKTTKKEGQHEFNNTWVEGDLIHSGGKLYIHPISNKVTVEGELGKLIVMHEIDPDTLCKDTGYCDHNGTKIWGNDVLELTENMSTIYVGGSHSHTTRWVNSFNWRCETTPGGLMNIARFASSPDFTRCEVIGNLIDNPELAEVRYRREEA